MLYRSLGESAGQFWQSAEFENVANQYFENLKHLQNPGDLLLAAASISLGNVPFQIHYLLESLFFCNIKGKNFWNNNIFYGNIKTALVGSDLCLRIAINTKNKWTIWEIYWVTFSCYIWCRTEGWHFRCISVIWWSDTFGTVVYYLFCKLDMDDLIFSEYSWRTPFRSCLYWWSSWYIVVLDFYLWT